MVMTFHGTNRTGEEESKHLHEAPPAMWVPLGVLAALSVVGGWINVPEEIRHSVLGLGGLTTEWLHHWLEPVTEAAVHLQGTNLGDLSHTAPFGGGELTWAFLSTGIAILVVGATFFVLSRAEVKTAATDGEPTGFGKILYNKWYVDEIYDRLIVQPLLGLSRFCWKVIDAGIIDGIVNLTGHLARAAGWFGSLFQTGQVNTYAFFLTVGVLWILSVIAL
jgi:NADH-quinone oxidoreductase subunit L